ncbi:hypothetical protein MJ588_22090 [Klebsiella pneumoniae]|nr:hypothetical protein MJ588_22090 [Klebsiella pneumoniae]
MGDEGELKGAGFSFAVSDTQKHGQGYWSYRQSRQRLTESGVTRRGTT